MHPAIAKHRASIAVICQRYGISGMEVFGAAVYGNDAAGSDLGGLRDELQEFLGFSADVLTAQDLPARFRNMAC